MNSKNIYKVTISIFVVVLFLLTFNLINHNVKNRFVDNNIHNTQIEERFNLINKFLMSLDNTTLKDIGISKKDIVNKDIQKYNINIISKNNNNYYILLHNKNIDNGKEYLTIFKRGAFSYRKIGKPIQFNNVIDVFMLETKTEEKHMIFVRDLIGFDTSPLDLTANLQAFVFNANKKDFVEAIKIVENMEEYQIHTDNGHNRYKKYRTKSDIMLTNSDKPVLEVLTNYYEAVSEATKEELALEIPYSLEFDIIKTDTKYSRYEYDQKYSHFIVGYLLINDTKEIVGIINKNINLINNNYTETYTIIKENGEVFEIFSDYTIIKIN